MISLLIEWLSYGTFQILITTKASDFLEANGLTEITAPIDVNDSTAPEFALKQVYSQTHAVVKRFVYPHRARSSKYISKMEGTIIHASEVPYYPVENICLLDNVKDVFFVQKYHLLHQSCFYNACLSLMKEGTGYAVYLHKPPKR